MQLIIQYVLFAIAYCAIYNGICECKMFNINSISLRKTQ